MAKQTKSFQDSPDLVANHPAIVTIRESQARRWGWVGGFSVQLADGMLWQVPTINMSVLITTPSLPAELATAFDLVEDLKCRQDNNKEQTVALLLYHAQMASIAVQLLRINYELTDDVWKRLITFNQLPDMLRLTLRVAEELARTVALWMPFALSSDLHGLENLELQ